jgi:hypothetical protein
VRGLKERSETLPYGIKYLVCEMDIPKLPAGLRGRVILGKGNDMEELIKRLERVIQTGVPDKDGMHPISAEAVLEVVKSQLSTNLAEVSTKIEPLTDKEQRIFLAAMGRERKVCKEVDDQYTHEPYEVLLTKVCSEIERKVKAALWS